MRFGLDLGGTKIEAIVLDDAGESIWRTRCPTPVADYQAILRTISDLVAQAEQRVGRAVSVGVGMPGSLSPVTRLVRNSNTLCLNGQAIQSDLESLLDRPIRLANDANCFALSEATDGAGQGAQCVFGVILGTGCGGGWVVNGQVWNGLNSIAGEWGHNPLPWPRPEEWPGPDCYCGRKGCTELWISGSGFARDHCAVTGEDLTAEEIMTRASGLASFERLCDRLARALAAVINAVDPEIIVLGGGLSNIDALYEKVPTLWKNYIFSDVIETRLVQNHHGDASGVRGAAWLWAR